MTTCPDLWLLLGVGASLLLLSTWSRRRRTPQPTTCAVPPAGSRTPDSSVTAADGRSLGAA